MDVDGQLPFCGFVSTLNQILHGSPNRRLRCTEVWSCRKSMVFLRIFMCHMCHVVSINVLISKGLAVGNGVLPPDPGVRLSGLYTSVYIRLSLGQEWHMSRSLEVKASKKSRPRQVLEKKIAGKWNFISLQGSRASRGFRIWPKNYISPIVIDWSSLLRCFIP